jgi:hypothetical protein
MSGPDRNDPSDPHRSTSSPRGAEPSAVVIDRRDFLRLGLGSAALLVGCGDDGAGGSEGPGTTGSSEGGSDPTTAEPTTGGSTDAPASTSTGVEPTTGDDTTGDGTTSDETTGDATTGDGTTGDGTTGDAELCEQSPAVRFDPEAVLLDAELFPCAVMAGEMRPESVRISVFIADAAPKTLRVWRAGAVVGEVELVHASTVTPSADGFMQVTVDGLCAGTWYSYGLFAGDNDVFTARSLIGEVRTAIAEDALEPLTLALAACNGSSLDWPAMMVTADEYYDMLIHLGDFAYNDGAETLVEYRASWREYLGVEGYKRVLARAGMYVTWDDHEIDDNSNFDRETMDPLELLRRQNAMDAFFEALPIDAEGPDYRLWRSFRWGLTAEIIVLDCRYERRPSLGQYISPEQMAFLQDRLLNSPCHFKVVMNSVPITNMPVAWDIAASDRWEGYPAQRKQVLDHIDAHDIKNVWFLSGDFHVCFVSRLEPTGDQLSHRTREIAVTSGNESPIPEFLTQLDPPQFAYGVHKARGLLVTFDPAADAVHVRFLDPLTGDDLYSETLTQS